jgi:hypothetical protein
VSGDPNWVPLEQIVELAGAAGFEVLADEFMAMGEVQLPDEATVYLYKHRDTRRYLNVDAPGHAYRFDDGRYEAWRSPSPAVAHVMGISVIYQCWTNVDARFGLPYERGDRLVKGRCDVVDAADPAPRLELLAEAVFTRHNRDDRPDGQLCPSMSIGDVVVFGDVSLSVDHRGFVRVDVDRADLILDRSWRQVIAGPAPAAVPTSMSRTAPVSVKPCGGAGSGTTPPSEPIAS